MSESQFDQNHNFVTSYLLSPATLATLRLTIALYTLVTNVFTLTWLGITNNEADAFFSYFTNLSLIGICAYFWAAGVQTVLYKKNGEKTYPLQTWPRILRYLHGLLYSTIVTYPLLVTIVYWALIASPSTFESRYWGEHPAPHPSFCCLV